MAGQAPGSGVIACGTALRRALAIGLAASGIGRSAMTSLTAELAASSLASPRDTVAEMALTREKLFTLRAWVAVRLDLTWLCTELTIELRRAALAGVSGRPATWFLKTMITLSVTLRDSARACAAVSSARALWARGAWVAACAVADKATSRTGVVIATLRNKPVCLMCLFPHN